MRETKKKRKIWPWLLGSVALLAALAAGAWITVFHINEFFMVMELVGEEKITLEYGDPYEEPGVQVTLFGTLFLKEGRVLEQPEVIISSDLGEQKPGRYQVEYVARLWKLQETSQRMVQIIDTEPPVIILKEAEEPMLLPGNVYQEPGFTAVDNCDGDITDRVICTPEQGMMTYAVTDLSGNPAVAEREILDYDPIPPSIDLIGGDRTTIFIGVPYVEMGFTAYDNTGVDLTAQVEVTGEVNHMKPGIYPIAYTVQDAAGNKTTVARKITVTGVDRPKVVKPANKTIYLTFDDGPGAGTKQLLDTLDQFGVKATFFVVDADNDAMLRQITEGGHSIGIHSVTHRYDQIYSSPEAYFADLYAMQETIYRATNVKTTLMRFPGGSSNEISRQYSPGIMSILTEAVQDAGFQYFDWNVVSGDAGETQDTETIVQNVIAGVQKNKYSIVLQHDIHPYSVAAVEQIILWGLDNGYTFEALTPTSPGCHQNVAN